MSRLPDGVYGKRAKITINALLSNMTEKSSHVGLALYAGAVPLGDLALEEELIELIKRDPDASSALRGFFRAYYSDDDTGIGKKPQFKDEPTENIKNLSSINF